MWKIIYTKIANFERHYYPRGVYILRPLACLALYIFYILAFVKSDILVNPVATIIAALVYHTTIDEEVVLLAIVNSVTLTLLLYVLIRKTLDVKNFMGSLNSQVPYKFCKQYIYSSRKLTIISFVLVFFSYHLLNPNMKSDLGVSVIILEVTQIVTLAAWIFLVEWLTLSTTQTFLYYILHKRYRRSFYALKPRHRLSFINKPTYKGTQRISTNLKNTLRNHYSYYSNPWRFFKSSIHFIPGVVASCSFVMIIMTCVEYVLEEDLPKPTTSIYSFSIAAQYVEFLKIQNPKRMT